MSHSYDAAADAAAEVWAASLPASLIDEIVVEFTAVLVADGITVVPYVLLHEEIDPNQLLADVCEHYPETDDGDDFYRLVALANRITDAYDASLR